MVRLEDEHQLVWQVDRGFTTDVGLCSCGWRLWSPHKDEIREAHLGHLEYTRRKQADADRHSWEIRCKDHKIHWDAAHYAARCSHCTWFMADANTAKVLVHWQYHLEGLRGQAEPLRLGGAEKTHGSS